MALKRSTVREWLSAANVEDGKIADLENKIIASHAATVDALNDKIDELQEEANKVAGLTKERDDAQKLVKDGAGWKAKYEELQKAQETDAKKELLGKALKEARANPAVIDLMLKSADYDKMVVENGAIKDKEKLIEGYKAEYKDLFGTESSEGAEHPTPPGGHGSTAMTPAEIAKIEDREERRRKIAENLESF